MDFYKILFDLGFPISSTIAAGYFGFLALKFILSGVTTTIKNMSEIIKSLNNRIDTMNNQVQRIDVKISHALGLQPDYERIARSELNDLRKD